MSAEENLKKLGLELPEAPKPVASYVPSVRTGNLVFVSGQLPFVNGELPRKGKLGRELTIEEGQQEAQQAVLNALAVVKAEAGSLDKVKRVVRVGGFVASAEGFNDQPKVINGASELLPKVLGDAGRHARAAVGVNELPLNAPVEVELVVELEA